MTHSYKQHRFTYEFESVEVTTFIYTMECLSGSALACMVTTTARVFALMAIVGTTLAEGRHAPGRHLLTHHDPVSALLERRQRLRGYALPDLDEVEARWRTAWLAAGGNGSQPAGGLAEQCRYR